MKELHLKDDAYFYSSNNKAVVVVTNYVVGDWCGDGEALALLEDGTVALYNLGHCSCYGPFENGPCETFESVEDFKVRISSAGTELAEKFLEVVSNPNY